MELAILLAILTMFIYGMQNVVAKKAVSYIDTVPYTLIVYVFVACSSIALWIFDPAEKMITANGFYFTLIIAILSVIASLAYFRALKFGNLSIVNPIRSMAFIVTVIGAVAILNESITILKVVGISLAVCAILLLAR